MTVFARATNSTFMFSIRTGASLIRTAALAIERQALPFSARIRACVCAQITTHASIGEITNRCLDTYAMYERMHVLMYACTSLHEYLHGHARDRPLGAHPLREDPL